VGWRVSFDATKKESSVMPKLMRLNAFDMNCVDHIQHGMWCHPRDRSCRYTDIDYWTDLARA
jgi:long-chain alkane monooxygenase